MEKASADSEKRGVHKKPGGMTRRNFLKGLGAGVALAPGTGVLINEGMHAYQKRGLILETLRGGHEKPEAAVNAIKYLKATYGVDVEIGDQWSVVGAGMDSTNSVETTMALQSLIEEMGKYPPDFFAKNKMTLIRIGKNVRMGDLFSEQTVGGFAESVGLKITLGFDPANPDFFSRVIHHEFNHVLSYIHSGDASNERWDQIHEGCTCTPNVRRTRQPGYQFDISDRSFINKYGETHASEERAEFGAMLMVPRLHARFVKRLALENEQDRTVLTRKYEEIKQLYFAWSAGKMDQDYWDAVVALAPEEAEDWYGSYDAGALDGSEYVSQDSSDVFEYENVKQ